MGKDKENGKRLFKNVIMCLEKKNLENYYQQQ